MARPNMSQVKGFTLIEMVTVIVLLGILSIGFTGFIKLGTQVYVDVTDRDELVASGRFAVERLNRELRMALPNSARLTAEVTLTKQCLEFYPISANVVYVDIPVSPELPSNTITLVYEDSAASPIDTYAVVYPLTADELYDGSSNRIHPTNLLATTAVDNEWLLTLTAAHTFAEDSPTKRLFFVGEPVSYCAEQKSTVWQLWRYQGYPVTAVGLPTTHGVLMAEHLTVNNLPFKVIEASLQRNASILTTLMFSRNDEDIVFNNEVQVRNVP